jgi:hypothetical protein
METNKGVLQFFISKGARQIRVLFSRETTLWSQVKQKVANLLDSSLDHLIFRNSSTNSSIDEEDDGTSEFLEKLGLTSHHIIVENVEFSRRKQEELMRQADGSSIFISFLDGRQFRFYVDLHSTTVGELKKMIDVMTGLIPQQQRLLFRNKQLDNESWHLSNYFVENGHTITCVSRFLDGVLSDVSEKDAIYADLSPLVIYDLDANHIVFSKRPFLFRSV